MAMEYAWDVELLPVKGTRPSEHESSFLTMNGRKCASQAETGQEGLDRFLVSADKPGQRCFAVHDRWRRTSVSLRCIRARGRRLLSSDPAQNSKLNEKDER